MHFLGNVRRLLISIHALLAESDLPNLRLHRAAPGFLSTLSLRRATRQIYQVENQSPFLSTLSLRRATCTVHTNHNVRRISIHALLAESDSKQGRHYIGCKIFLSTLSLRRATLYACFMVRFSGFLSTLSLRRATSAEDCKICIYDISIHALLAESDCSGFA